jgi:putative intracellular protease/amidase
MSHILIPIPDLDFDPSEVAVTWQVLRAAGHTVSFATESGTAGAADDIMVTGIGLDLWSGIPGLRHITLLGALLRANAIARTAYRQMLISPEFIRPLRWTDIDATKYDALFLPGGHRARGMRVYLESKILQDCVVSFFKQHKPVAAICHGVLLAARSIDPATGRSVLHGRKTTSLTWAQERTASRLNQFGRVWDRQYYRTYPDLPGQTAGFMGVQAEVTRALADPADFIDVTPADPLFRRKTSGLARDTLTDSTPAHVVRDRNYLSARWPGDVHTLAVTFSAMLLAPRQDVA